MTESSGVQLLRSEMRCAKALTSGKIDDKK